MCNFKFTVNHSKLENCKSYEHTFQSFVVLAATNRFHASLPTKEYCFGGFISFCVSNIREHMVSSQFGLKISPF